MLCLTTVKSTVEDPLAPDRWGSLLIPSIKTENIHQWTLMGRRIWRPRLRPARVTLHCFFSFLQNAPYQWLNLHFITVKLTLHAKRSKERKKKKKKTSIFISFYGTHRSIQRPTHTPSTKLTSEIGLYLDWHVHSQTNMNYLNELHMTPSNFEAHSHWVIILKEETPSPKLKCMWPMSTFSCAGPT